MTTHDMVRDTKEIFYFMPTREVTRGWVFRGNPSAIMGNDEGADKSADQPEGGNEKQLGLRNEPKLPWGVDQVSFESLHGRERGKSDEVGKLARNARMSSSADPEKVPGSGLRPARVAQ